MTFVRRLIDRLPKPKASPYDAVTARQGPWAERVRLACRAWAQDGYGAPGIIYLLYVVKIWGYIWIWSGFCAQTPQLGNWSDFEHWWWQPVAFQKSVLWAMAYEIMGFGCSSGPLGGRYVPPIGGLLYFLRPGTVKLPFFPKLSIFGAAKRSILDVALYALFLVFVFRVLLSATITASDLYPIIGTLLLLGITDKTLFLAARSEHYFVMTVCFCFGEQGLAGAMVVQLALWFWAGVSKLTPHFPAVLAVMTSNHPLVRSPKIRQLMYRDAPHDLRPSKLAHILAHMGSGVELLFPILLIFGDGATLTFLGLTLGILFHVYITSNFPMAVPIEWNVNMVYGAFFFFGGPTAFHLSDISSPLLWGYLFLTCFLIPLVGNLEPRLVSFLLSMRYYAGNWAYGVWLFKGDAVDKLNTHLSGLPLKPEQQLALLYPQHLVAGLMEKVIGFRAMHLHGRALQFLMPKAVDDIREYSYYDGELVAGMVLGWNFGDGHLHHEQLLDIIQDNCRFEPGELRCIFVESQPLLRREQAWRIVDANAGLLAKGVTPVSELKALQPWPPCG